MWSTIRTDLIKHTAEKLPHTKNKDPPGFYLQMTAFLYSITMSESEFLMTIWDINVQSIQIKLELQPHSFANSSWWCWSHFPWWGGAGEARRWSQTLYMNESISPHGELMSSDSTHRNSFLNFFFPHDIHYFCALLLVHYKSIHSFTPLTNSYWTPHMPGTGLGIGGGIAVKKLMSIFVELTV